MAKKYKIVGFCQIYNELEKGNLKRFVKHFTPLVDELVVYDDSSTDGSYEYMQGITPHIIRGSKNEFKNEIFHKQKLLEKALSLKPDFILSLDADEVLTSDAAEKFQDVCKKCLDENLDAISFHRINLWNSKSWSRLDSKFNLAWVANLWRVKENLSYTAKTGLHQPGFPSQIKKIGKTDDIKIIHYGFADEVNLAYKYWIYRKNGQRGYDMLDRLVSSGSNFKTEKVPQNYFPNDLKSDDPAPQPVTLKEALKVMDKYKDTVFRPKFSIVSLIYKDTKWLEFAYSQILKNTDMENKELFFVANDATQEVKKYLKNSYIPHYIFENTPEQKKEFYINNVYRAWNFAGSKAKGDFVIFINSDMAFTPNWFENLWDKYNGKNCIASRLIESGKLRSGQYGIEKNFGKKIKEFKETDFLNYASVLSKPALKNGGLYMPLLIRKEHFLSVGGYPEGNIVKGSDIHKPVIAKKGEPNLTPGDKVLMEKLKEKGINHQTAFDSIVYHFQCGEMDSRPEKTSDTKPLIAICNTDIQGTMGEKVLWQHMAESLPSVVTVDKINAGKASYAEGAKKYINKKFPSAEIIFQNASFIDLVDNSKYTVLYLQDNLRAMKLKNRQQEYNLKNADVLVTNSKITALSYDEYDFEIIPVGVDSELFTPLENKEEIRKEFQLPDKKTGIFVGNFSEVKGWCKIKDLISKHPETHWILVTKNEENYNAENVTVFSRIPQSKLAKLYNAADFFIVGSPVETQCLAAIEAAMCNIPVIMNNTGIFADFTEEEKNKIGFFDGNFDNALQTIFSQSFEPRKTVLGKGLDIKNTMRLWHKLFEKARMNSKSQKYITESKAGIFEKTINLVAYRFDTAVQIIPRISNKLCSVLSKIKRKVFS